jgi:hypothetical protein
MRGRHFTVVTLVTLACAGGVALVGACNTDYDSSAANKDGGADGTSVSDGAGDAPTSIDGASNADGGAGDAAVLGDAGGGAEGGPCTQLFADNFTDLSSWSAPSMTGGCTVTANTTHFLSAPKALLAECDTSAATIVDGTVQRDFTLATPPPIVELDFALYVEPWTGTRIEPGCALVLTQSNADERVGLLSGAGMGMVSASLRTTTQQYAQLSALPPTPGWYRVSMRASGLDTGSLTVLFTMQQVGGGGTSTTLTDTIPTPTTAISVVCGISTAQYLGNLEAGLPVVDAWVDDVSASVCH